ncbi:MAG: thiamine pyrophosphate-binding protein, partial [Candidatus Lokiarchaeota archaeon]|nr:thiamine pyrophosphate-binding protein [Candidatus Lokiarchaeota archaeon]
MSKEKKEESYNGGDLFVQCLLNEGVEYIFGIVGGQLLAIYDAINRWGKDKGIDTIMTRHEQAAGHMADGYARVTGKIGVCMGTVGPGVTHLIPAVAAAYMDSIPLLVIGAQILRVENRKGVYQGDVQQIEMLRPITKFQIRVEEPNEIPGAVRACFIEALSGRQRPVFLEIRESALTGRVSKEIMEQLWSPELYRPQTKLFGDPKQIEKALELLKNAKKPFLIVGGGVMRSGAWEE